jgi:RNA polymerase sigma-70 factor, ECF subfamily
MNSPNPPNPDERDLLRRLRSGSRAAFEALMDRHERRVYNLALRMLGDPTEAEDAAQEIFVEVHRSLPGFKGNSRLDTWIHRIAVNVCLQRRRKRSLPTVGMPDEELLVCPDGDPYQAAARGELQSVVAAALERLPESQRDVVVLHGIQGLSYAEVAAALDCPVGTVKSRLSTAFRRLRTLLGGYVLEEAGERGALAAAEGVK